jgi:hypothetical protein
MKNSFFLNGYLLIRGIQIKNNVNSIEIEV